MKKLLLLVHVILLLSACGKSSRSTIETITPLQSATQTQRPTRTPGPTRTRPPTLSPDPSLTAEYLVHQGTRTAIATIYAPFSQYCDIEAHGAYISPDKNWDYCNTGVRASLIGRDGAYWQFWLDEYFGQVINFSVLPPALWTRDGRFIYFPIGHPQPEGPSSLTLEELPILGMFRMDLSNGKVDAILPATVDYLPWYGFSFSPDEHWLAWSEASQSGSFNLRNLVTDDEYSFHFDRQYSVNEFDKSAFSWSQDNQRLTVRLQGKYGYSLAEINVLKRSTMVISRATPYPTTEPSPTP